MKAGMVLLAAPVASADAKLLLSVATESNHRTQRGLPNVESGRQPPLDSPAAKVSCVKELLSTT